MGSVDEPRTPGWSFTRERRRQKRLAGPQVEEGAFVKEHFDELCWTLTAKKNYRADGDGKGHSPLSNQDAFRLWGLFNFLSEDKYPLIMVPDEVRVTSEPEGGVTEGRSPRQSREGRQGITGGPQIP